MTKSEKSLKELLAEFENIVAWFDNDELDVEAAINKYEAGVKLSEEIKNQLDSAKNHISVVKQKFDE
jgi:exodeoxyribonuclease VII small subunit